MPEKTETNSPVGHGVANSVTQLAAFIWCGTFLFAAVLIMRRLNGAITPPDSSLWAITAAIISGIVTVLTTHAVLPYCTRITNYCRTNFWQNQEENTPKTAAPQLAESTIAESIITVLPPFLIAAAILPTNSPAAIAALITTTLLFLFGRIYFKTAAPISNSNSETSTKPQLTAITPDEVINDSIITENISTENNLTENNLTEEDSTNNVSQWMSRSLIDNGTTDLLEGTIQATLPAGQKIVTVHIPFTPPFHETPHCECETEEVSNDDDIRLRQVSIKSYGARIDIRRSQATNTATKIQLAYTATAPNQQENAA